MTGQLIINILFIFLFIIMHLKILSLHRQVEHLLELRPVQQDFNKKVGENLFSLLGLIMLKGRL